MHQNRLVREFLTQLQSRYSIDALTMSMSDWVATNTTLRGKPFTFDRYPFQTKIVDDMHPDLHVTKCSQVGLSEIQIRKMLGFLDRNQGTTGIFTMPTQPMRDRLAKTRVKPLVDSDPVFNKERDRGATRSAFLYQLGISYLHVTDSTEGSATSIPADILFSDEVDLSDQSMLSLFNSRLQNSDFKIRQSFSTPTHVAYGIDAGFGATDQHEYMCRCAHCGHWNIPEFTPAFVSFQTDLLDLSEIEEHHLDELDIGNAYICCERCRKPLDLADPSMREWVPRHPHRTQSRGYRVTPFCTDRLPVNYIVNQLLQYKRSNFIRGWHNTVLGQPFTGGNDRLIRADIETCLTSPSAPDLPGKAPIAVGIDSGITCHVVLFDNPDQYTSQIFSMETVHSERLVEYITALSSRYNIVTGGMDRHPQTVLANQVLEASGGKIWPIEYRGTKDINPVKDVTGTDVVHFQCDRTGALDRVATRVRARNLKMSGYGVQKEIIVSHLTNMVRDETPETPAVWKKLDDADHYFHAMANGLTSMRINGYFEATNEKDPRQVVNIMGIQTKPSQNLFGRPSALASNLPGC